MRNGSVVRRRMLGRRLRLLREEAGLTLDEAAPRLDWSTSTLSRIETGQQAPNVHGVRSMLDLYGAGGPTWDELITLTREVRQKSWWRAYRLGEHAFYVGYENEASMVQEFSLAFFPGLLQIADYSRALFTTVAMRRTEAELADEVAVRMIRQERLTSVGRPAGAGGDRGRVGAPPAGRRPRRAAGAVAAPGGGRRAGLGDRAGASHLGRRPRRDGLHLHRAELRRPRGTGHCLRGALLGALQLEKEAEVARARLTFDRLRSAALGPAESLAVIRRAAEQE